MQSGDEYIQFRRDGYRYRNGWDQPFTDEDVFEPAELAVIKSRDFTDWIDLLYRTVRHKVIILVSVPEIKRPNYILD